MRRVNKIDYRFHKDSEREECMERIEEVRRQSIYHHKEDTCTAECKKRDNYSACMHDCMCIIIIEPNRLWFTVGYRWNLEDCFPTLHVQS